MGDLVERLRASVHAAEAHRMPAIAAQLTEAADALEAALEDAERYRWLADNRCDVTICASTTDYGDGDTTYGPRVEVDPDQFGPEYGSPKAKLDAEIERLRESRNG